MKRIAFLRGINVSGHRIIKMADLKQLFLDLGFENVLTYIQSGNVIFDAANDLSHREVSAIVSKGIFEQFGFDVPVIILTREELTHLISKNPYATIPDVDPKRWYVTLLSDTSEEKEINAPLNCQDKFVLMDKQVYILLEAKYHESKLTNNWFESKLKVKATTRNWKTLKKILEMAQ